MTIRFDFSSTDNAAGIARYECYLNGTAILNCTSPQILTTGLGVQNFVVAAFDKAQNASLTNASYSWEVVPQAAPLAKGPLSIAYEEPCAIQNGFAQCWGWGITGNAYSTTPTAVPGLSASTTTSVAFGFGEDCAVMNGGAYCWGYNGEGELGDGTTITRSIPTPVLGLSSGVTAITTGIMGACAIKSGAVYCWGLARDTGTGSASNVLIPTIVTGLEQDVDQVITQRELTCALRKGTVWCWGAYWAGLVTNGVMSYSEGAIPLAMRIPGMLGVKQIAVTANGVCGLIGAGVFCWGSNAEGLLSPNMDRGMLAFGNSIAIPSLVDGITAISAGEGSVCVVRNGAVFCWGVLLDGNNGPGSGTEVIAYAPRIVPELESGATAIAVGYANACAVRNAGVVCWGRNNLGQLGNGTMTNSSTPVRVTGLSSGF